jgi:DNA helicase-2/ATP-dependent DNA helicase PcrA
VTSSKDLIIGNLNPAQQEAVLHTQGPAFILAGAGSGKTRALTHRIAHLIDQGVPPWQILAVTFTNKAATEMKERIKNLLHITEGVNIEPDPYNLQATTYKLPTMGTFHSICVRILRRDIERLGRDRSFVIYDSDDQEKLMKEALKDLKIDEKELKPRAALGYVSRFKSEAVSPKQAEMEATTDRLHKVILAYKKYSEKLKECNALDFDDLILETVRLFQEVPEVLDRYQETWRYLHVDEYQDTNHTQYLMMSLLAQKYRNLCVIGDPDQSIYAFRGADIRNILEFEKEYPDAFRVTLDENYRSAQPILSASNSVIAANPNRPEKSMWTNRKEGPKVIVQEVRDEKMEAQEAVRAAMMLAGQNVPLKDQVILYRTNAQSRLFEEACLRAGIPYRIVGGLKFYARKEVKDVLAYLHAIVNPQDTLALLRILNVPARKIGDTTIGHLQAYGSVNNTNLWSTLEQSEGIDSIPVPTRGRLVQFVELLAQFRKRSLQVPVSVLTEELLSAIKFEEWIKDGTEEGDERWGNVMELLTVMHKYDAVEPHLSLTSFLEEVSLVSEVDKLATARDDALTLMTLHLCKGLEFESVFIVGCEEGVFPSSQSLFDREQLEEERRVMYVGMTRAKTHLRLMCARSRMLYGNTQSNPPSRFMDDLPHDVVERRSDELLSAFAWASERGEHQVRKSTSKLEPFRQHDDSNQDLGFDEVNQDSEEVDQFEIGSRVVHPSFGMGEVVSRRGDVATIAFDSGVQKTFALSIAPLRRIG